MPDLPDDIQFDSAGLVPVVVQEGTSGRVLMLAYATQGALDATATTGYAHFWSRSRKELWKKGATSGNTLTVTEVRSDCDGDAVLYVVGADGPACHTGSETCFTDETDVPAAGFFALERLDAVIRQRASDLPAGSYTARLIREGVEGPARKVVEEAAEVAFAAKDHAQGNADDRRVAEEAGDVLYHLLVLLAERGIPTREVIDALAERAR